MDIYSPVQVTFFIEAGDIWHLDFQVTSRSNEAATMHGILGCVSLPVWVYCVHHSHVW